MEIGEAAAHDRHELVGSVAEVHAPTIVDAVLLFEHDPVGFRPQVDRLPGVLVEVGLEVVDVGELPAEARAPIRG